MFTPHHLYDAFRDTVLPRRGQAPALTRRSLKACRVHRGLIDLSMVEIAIVAEIPTRHGPNPPYTQLFADHRRIARDGLKVQIPIGVQMGIGHYHWVPVIFHDGSATCDLGAWIMGLSGIAITITPHHGTTTFALPEGLTGADDSNIEYHPDSFEGRISSTLSRLDEIAKSAMRRDLARIAHPDIAPESERLARNAALAHAFSVIERGRFIVDA